MIARIAHDQQQHVSYSLKAIPDFNPDSVRWEMIGPVFENHFGIMFHFPVNPIANLEYDAEKWS